MGSDHRSENPLALAMGSVKEALYEGKVYPAEMATANLTAENAEYGSLVTELANRMDDYSKSMDKETYQKVEAVMDLVTKVHNIESIEHFRYGLSLGLRLMEEAGKLSTLESAVKENDAEGAE